MQIRDVEEFDGSQANIDSAIVSFIYYLATDIFLLVLRSLVNCFENTTRILVQARSVVSTLIVFFILGCRWIFYFLADIC